MAKKRRKAPKPARKLPPPKSRRKPLPRKPPKKQAKKKPSPKPARKPLPRKPVKRKAPPEPIKKAKPPKRYKRPKTREPRRKPVVAEPPPLSGPGNVFGPLDVQPSLLDFLKKLVGAVDFPTKEAAAIPEVRWAPPAESDEEIGFNLRDTGLLDPGLFIGRDEVTMSVTVTRFEDRRPVRTEKVVTFEPGSDDIDFWYNYHAALREVLGEVGSDVSIGVTAMTA